MFAVVEGSLFVVIQGIGVRTSRNKRAAIRRAECNRIAHQGTRENTSYVVLGIRPANVKAEVLLKSSPNDSVNSHVQPSVAESLYNTMSAVQRKFENEASKVAMVSTVSAPMSYTAFGGCSEGLDGAVYRTASSHR